MHVKGELTYANTLYKGIIQQQKHVPIHTGIWEYHRPHPLNQPWFVERRMRGLQGYTCFWDEDSHRCRHGVKAHLNSPLLYCYYVFASKITVPIIRESILTYYYSQYEHAKHNLQRSIPSLRIESYIVNLL